MPPVALARRPPKLRKRARPRARAADLPGTAHEVCSVGILLGIMVALSSCANDYPADLVPPVPTETAAPELYRTTLEPSYMIGPGDSLLIQSYYHPDLRQPVTVQTDGRVSLLLVGDVMAAGKTPEQLAGELTRAYDKFLENADVTVTLSESAGLSVYVGGEVARPAMEPIRGELTLLQSIAQAGGFLPTGNREQVLIIRQTTDGRYRTLQANAEQVLRNEAGEIYLRRHDIVYVPKTEIAKADQFVDQYINQIVPRSVNAVFGYQFIKQGAGTVINSSGGTTVSPAATATP